MKSWYEKRIEEETIKNKKLQELHDSLIQIRDLQKRQAEMNQLQTEKLRHQLSTSAEENEEDKIYLAKFQQQQSMEQEIDSLR